MTARSGAGSPRAGRKVGAFPTAGAEPWPVMLAANCSVAIRAPGASRSRTGTVTIRPGAAVKAGRMMIEPAGCVSRVAGAPAVVPGAASEAATAELASGAATAAVHPPARSRS